MILKVLLIFLISSTLVADAVDYDYNRCLTIAKSKLCMKFYPKSKSGCLEMIQVDIFPKQVCLQGSVTDCYPIPKVCLDVMQLKLTNIDIIVDPISKVKQKNIQKI